MFLTRSEYDRSVPRGEMRLGYGRAAQGAQPRPGFCRVMGRPGNPRRARRGGLLPSSPPAVIPQPDFCPSAALALPLSHRWALTGSGSETPRFVLGEEAEGRYPDL